MGSVLILRRCHSNGKAGGCTADFSVPPNWPNASIPASKIRMKRGSMNMSVVDRLMDEMIPSLEALETQNAAILEFLKDKKITTDETLAPYLERAGNASNVRWRASRLRITSMLSSAMRSDEQSAQQEKEASDKEADSKEQNQAQAQHKEKETDAVKEQAAEKEKPDIQAIKSDAHTGTDQKEGVPEEKRIA